MFALASYGFARLRSTTHLHKILSNSDLEVLILHNIIKQAGINPACFITPEEIRTPDLLVRSQTLYPAELRAHILLNCHVVNDSARETCLACYLTTQPVSLDSTSRTALASACLTARRRAAELRAHILLNCHVVNDSARETCFLSLPKH